MIRTAIVVKKGLHPENAEFINDIQRGINRSTGWITLGSILVAKENDDLDITVKTATGYMDQGIYYLYDTINLLEDDPEIEFKINFKHHIENGVKRVKFDEHKITNEDVQGANVVMECVRTANPATNSLEYKIILWRDGNKRNLTLVNT